jgi:DNA-binding response OmpR family regulator
MKKILVVDDETDILFMLKTYLVFNGYETKVSTSCDEGLDIFYAFQPDIVLIDVNVGSADGRVMCRAIKANAEYRHIPVILISANPDGLASYQEHGAHAAVEKPFNFPQLLNLLQSVVR